MEGEKVQGPCNRKKILLGKTIGGEDFLQELFQVFEQGGVGEMKWLG